MKYIKKNWFIIIFCLSIIFPLYGWIADNRITLSGVTSDIEKVDNTFENIGDGSYQTYINNVWENSFPGKKVLLKIRNQLLYSCLKVSPNSNVVIGKDNYLFEPSYLLFQNMAYAPSSQDYFDTLSNNLATLKKLLEENDKELYIFITPSKARYYSDKSPIRYELLDNTNSYDESNYEMLLSTLTEADINYFDSIEYIDENIGKNGIEAPVFYASGIHWSHPWGNTCAAEFLNMINDNSKYSLGTLKVEEEECDSPVAPSTDLYDSLNIIEDADETWYKAITELDSEGTDHPNVFFRGGSFMGQSIDQLIRNGIFGENVHFENSYYFTDDYSESYTLSGFSAYDEIDLDYLVGKSDILILEVNEGAISQMSWGFIDELLNHPEYLDREYQEEE